MKVTGIGICPPPGARENPSVTPELLASCLARYSRSNKGIDTILGSIDWNDPEKAVDAIFKFVDYGHASITGMTGGIAIAIDGCSMFLAYKIFEIAQLCDGQESSTRYIRLDNTNIPDPDHIGIPKEFASEWNDLMTESFKLYQETYATLDQNAIKNPAIIRIPNGTDQKIADRIRKNYALDRARYFIPFATKTNAAYVMTARVWAETVRQLDSLQINEASLCANLIRKELEHFVPRMTRHSLPTENSTIQADITLNNTLSYIKKHGLSFDKTGDKFHLSIENSQPDFMPDLESIEDAFKGKVNRYSSIGTSLKRVFVRAAWNNMAIAELRDLNRHRSGFRYSPLIPVGFYLPSGVSHPDTQKLLEKTKSLISKIVMSKSPASYVYALHLGTQVPFEHSTHLDKFIYEIELRTGLGAHFRYAEHLLDAYNELIRKMPELKGYIQIGNAEPEL